MLQYLPFSEHFSQRFLLEWHVLCSAEVEGVTAVAEEVEVEGLMNSPKLCLLLGPSLLVAVRL